MKESITSSGSVGNTVVNQLGTVGADLVEEVPLATLTYVIGAGGVMLEASSSCTAMPSPNIEVQVETSCTTRQKTSSDEGAAAPVAKNDDVLRKGPIYH